MESRGGGGGGGRSDGDLNPHLTFYKKNFKFSNKSKIIPIKICLHDTSAVGRRAADAGFRLNCSYSLLFNYAPNFQLIFPVVSELRLDFKRLH